MDKMLPPLPSWDEDSLARNKFDAQFMKGTRDFWAGNRLERVELKETNPHDHIFQYTENGVECKVCRIGWIGKEFEIKDGELYFNNKRIKM